MCSLLFEDSDFLIKSVLCGSMLLCVNQEDVEERSRQVLLMRDIYAKPERVIVWLGEDEGDTAEAIKFIRNTAEYFYSELGKDPSDEIQYSISRQGSLKTKTTSRQLLLETFLLWYQITSIWNGDR